MSVRRLAADVADQDTIPITAALDDEYAPAIGLPSLPATEATLTIRP